MQNQGYLNTIDSLQNNKTTDLCLLRFSSSMKLNWLLIKYVVRTPFATNNSAKFVL